MAIGLNFMSPQLAFQIWRDVAAKLDGRTLFDSPSHPFSEQAQPVVDALIRDAREVAISQGAQVQTETALAASVFQNAAGAVTGTADMARLLATERPDRAVRGLFADLMNMSFATSTHVAHASKHGISGDTPFDQVFATSNLALEVGQAAAAVEGVVTGAGAAGRFIQKTGRTPAFAGIPAEVQAHGALMMSADDHPFARAKEAPLPPDALNMRDLVALQERLAEFREELRKAVKSNNVGIKNGPELARLRKEIARLELLESHLLSEGMPILPADLITNSERHPIRHALSTAWISTMTFLRQPRALPQGILGFPLRHPIIWGALSLTIGGGYLSYLHDVDEGMTEEVIKAAHSQYRRMDDIQGAELRKIEWAAMEREQKAKREATMQKGAEEIIARLPEKIALPNILPEDVPDSVGEGMMRYPDSDYLGYLNKMSVSAALGNGIDLGKDFPRRPHVVLVALLESNKDEPLRRVAKAFLKSIINNSADDSDSIVRRLHEAFNAKRGRGTADVDMVLDLLQHAADTYHQLHSEGIVLLTQFLDPSGPNTDEQRARASKVLSSLKKPQGNDGH